MNTAPFIRRSWYSVLPVLDMMGRFRVKKVVVGVIAAVVPIHGVLAFLVDMYCLFDPPGKVLRLPVNHQCFGSFDYKVLLSCVTVWSLRVANVYLSQSSVSRDSVSDPCLYGMLNAACSVLNAHQVNYVTSDDNCIC